MLKTIPLIARVSMLAIACATNSVADDNHSPAESVSLQLAVDKLSQSAGWRHLEANWIDSVTAVTADGPEMNVDVTVVSADGEPVGGAVVVIQESIDEAYYRVSLSSETYQPIRAMRATDAHGQCSFDSVSTTPTPAGRFGRIKAYVAVAHPYEGFDFYPLLRTSRRQSAKVVMDKRVSMSVVMRDSALVPEVRITRFARGPQIVMGGNGFATDTIFGPRAIVNDRGLGMFMNLPAGHFVDLDVHGNEGWKKAGLKALVPTDSTSVPIGLDEPISQTAIRFFDALSDRPVSDVYVDRWKHPNQRSGDDGLVVIKPALRDRAFRFGSIEKFGFTVEPPYGWVRESVSEYPHGIRSPPAAYRLTPSTIVRGQVVDARTGQGIEGVVVQSQCPIPKSRGVTREFHAVAVSDAAGSFELSAPPGRQTVSVAAPVADYLLPREQRLSVVMGKPVQGLTIKLMPAEPIRGRVVDQNGHTVVGVEVICHSEARTSRFRGGFPVDATIVSARTNNDGEFAVIRPPGDYDSLMLKAIAGDRQSRDAVIDFDPKSNRPVNVDLELSLGQPTRSVELSGIVLKDGRPWAGATVTVDPPVVWRHHGESIRGGTVQRGSAQLGETTTDEQGRYRVVVDVQDFSSLTLGVRSTPNSRSISAALIALNARQIAVPPIEIREKVGGMTIRGTVIDPRGLPVVGVHVSASGQRPSIRPARAAGDDPHHATTDPHGRFLLRELYAGPVDIRVAPAGVPTGHAVLSQLSIPAGETDALIAFDPSLSQVPERIDPVRVAPLDETRKTIHVRADARQLDPRTRIRGLVVDQNDTPVARAVVRVFCVTTTDSPGQNNPLIHPSCNLVTKTNSQGQFAIGPFPTGANVRIAAGAEGLSASVTDFLSLAEDDVIAEIRLSRLDPDLPAMKTTHQLIDASGKPIPMAIVSTAYSEYSDILSFSSDRGPCVLTDAEGNFRFPTVAGVDYMTVGVFPIGGSATVIENNYSHRNYRLANSMTIRGRTVDENGNPIADLELLVRGDRSPGHIRVVTSRNGTFQIDGLAGGGECSLSGASTSQPKHFLLQRRFDGVRGQLLDFGDLIAKPAATLAVKLVPAPGKGLPAGSSVQIGSQRVNVNPDGTAIFPAVSPSAVLMQVNNGQTAIDRTDPLLQQTLAGPFGVTTMFGINTAETHTVIVYLK